MSQTLILFLILLLGLILCSFLGGYNCNSIEGYTNQNNGAYGGQVTTATGVQGNTAGVVVGPNGNVYTASNVNGQTNANYRGNTQNGSNTITQSTYYAQNGDTATVTKVNDTYRIAITKQNGNVKYYSYTPPTSSDTNDDAAIQGSTFTGPYGTTARIVTDNNGSYIIEVTYPSGKKVVYSDNGGNSDNGNNNEQFNSYNGDDGYYDQNEYDMDDTDDNDNSDNYGSNGTNSASYYGPNGGQTNYVEGPNGGQAGYVQGPGGNSAGYVQGPAGNTVTTTNTQNNVNPEDYYNSLPQGIPANMIPPGDEDLYILKSQVVPPVCPACPTSSACPREEPCPACPPCARCPEPSFECKKVPNYNSNSNNYLPMPVLNDFTTFGM